MQRSIAEKKPPNNKELLEPPRENFVSTVTIDLGSLLTESVTSSGSFDLRRFRITTFARLLEALPIPTLLINPLGSVIFGNQACGKISLDHEKMRGIPFSTLLPDRASGKRVQSMMDKVFADRKPRVSEALLGKGKGKTWARMNFRAIRIGKERAILLLIEDLTLEKKQLQFKQRHSEQLVGEIAKRTRTAQLLRKSEERLRLAWETCPDAFSVSRLDNGTYVDVNTGYLELTGYDREELVGKSALHLPFWHNPADRARLVSGLAKDGYVKDLETKMRRKDGEVRTVLISAGVMTLDGEAHILALTKDVEDIKKAAEAIRRSEQSYRQLVESATDIIYRTDSNGCFTFVNPIAIRLTGYSEDEIIGRNYLEVVHPERRKEVARFYGIQFVKKLADSYYELPLLSKKGETIWVGQHVQLLLENDAPVGFQAIARDITDRKLAECALDQERLRFHTLAEQAPYAIAMLSADGRFLYTNPRFQEMFGYDLREIPTGRDWFRKAYPDDEYRHQVIAAWLEDLAGSGVGEQRPRVFTVTCKDGLKKIVHFRPVQLQTGEHLMTCEDITDRVYAERILAEHVWMLENILDKAADGICVCHNIEEFPYVRFTHWNPRMTEITGYNMAEINQEGWYQTMYPDPATRQAAAERMARMRDGEDIRAEEWVIATKDGTPKPLSISTSVVKEEDGQIHVLAIMQDITKRKKDEAALRESEDRFRSTFEQAAVGICHVSPDGRFLRVNQKLCDILGYNINELLSLTFQEITHPDDLESDVEYVRQILADKVQTYSMEKRYIRKDGSPLWANLTVSLTRELSGAPRYFISVVEDISYRKTAEQALLDSEERYRALVEESFDGIYAQKSGKIVFANSQLSQMLGYSGSELVGMDHWRIYHPDYHEVTSSWAQAYMRGESVPSRYEVKLQRSNGASFDAEISAKAVMVEGQPGIQVWIRDITERKKAEESLRESEERYRELFHNSADLIYTHDLDGNFTSVNRAVEGLLGYAHEEFMKLNIWQVIDPEHLNATAENLRMKVNAHFDRTGPYEVLGRTKSGQPVWLEVNSRALIHEGQLIGIHGTARDISDRKLAQEQLRKLLVAVEQAGETIVVTDPTGKIEYVNPSFESTTGYSVEEAIGQNPRIVKSGRHDRAFYREMWETIAEGRVWRGRLTNRRRDGTLYEETATISPVKDEKGAIINYIAVKRDVTSEVSLQKQLLQAQKMEALGTLAGGMAHDFNNLLQAILGYSDILLMKKSSTDPDRKKLEVIQQAALDGADLVSRILAFSRKAETKVRPIELNEEIRRVDALLRRILPKMIQIDLVLAEDLSIINANPAQIEQVLLNLGINAQHAMPDGGQLLIETSNVSISDEYLQTHLGSKPGRYVLLTVSDTGVGIEPAVLDRIFEPFFTTKTNGEGTGLGLSMVHGIIIQHGGFIRCYSEPGRGTSFKIYFPVADKGLASNLAVTREMAAFGTETVLLVDDDDRIREMGRQMIEMGGYRVIAAGSGEEALEVYSARKEEISLIILDLIMPGMGGGRCLQELLRIDPDARVLVASGYSGNGLVVGEKGKGARGFVSKPYDSKDIFIAIRKVLDKGYL